VHLVVELPHIQPFDGVALTGALVG